MIRLPASIRAACVLAVVSALAACANRAPTQFYTLLAPAEATPVPAESGYAIELLPVVVPEQVDVPQLVLRSGSGALQPVDTRRWAAPLGEELRTALSARLSARLGVRDVYRLTPPASLPLYRIRVRVGRFDSVPADYALLDAGWSVERRDDRSVRTCDARYREDVGAGIDALVAGHQQALARLADDIAATLRRFDAGGCPDTRT